MSNVQTMKTGVHEVSHALLHDREVMDAEGVLKDQTTKEVEAESIAYIVCNHFGLDTSEYSFTYIASWCESKDMKALRASMDTIRKTSAEVIGNIETQIHELEMERPIEDASLENIEETAMQYAHRLIEAAEDASRGNFTDSQRNLIVNFAYKMDDKDEVLGLVNRMMTAIRRPGSEYTRSLMNETQAQIDNFSDGVIGFTEMHEAGIRLEHMYPLEKNRAVELYREGAEVFLLHGNPDNPEQAGQILAETENAILGHDGIFGITEAEWEVHKEREAAIARQEKLELDRALKTSGQAFALSRVRAARTPDGRYEELMSGCSYAAFVGEAVRHFDQEGDAFCVHLAAVAKQVFGDCAVTLSLGADAGLMDSARAHLIRTGRAENLTAPLPLPEADRSDVCVRIVGGVSYDAMCSTLSDVGGEYSGALRVAARAVSLGYLWNAVRVRGGAYGVGASFTESGVLTFYSYRDPHIGQTYRAFEGAGDYLRNYSPDESELAKLIVGAAATLDRPKLPKDEAVAADYRYFLGLSDEMVLRRRAQLLDTDCKTLHATANLFDRLCGKAARCTVGAGTALDRESDLFDRELKI